MTASAKVKARLKAMRKKFYLGEFSRKAMANKPKRTVKVIRVRKKSSGGLNMARRFKVHRKGGSKMGGIMALAKYATQGVGTATIVSQATGGITPVPFFHELTGAAGAYAMNKSVKSAMVGGLAVAAVKYLPNLAGNLGATKAGIVLN